MKRMGLLLIAGLLYSAIAFPQFRIEGKIGKGSVYLVTENDTLGKTVSKNGKFVIKGKVSEPVIAFLVLEDVKYKSPIFLENADFSVQPGSDNKSLQITGGGELQKQEQEYWDTFQENDRDILAEKAKLKEAREKKNLFEVMMRRANLLDLDSVRNEIENRFIAGHPNSLVSLYHFYTNMGDLDFGQMQAKYNLLGDEMKKTEWGKVITARYENWERVAIGSVAPDFTLNTPEGKPVSLYGIKAKVKILDFWASWCGPCRAENPEVVELYRKYHSKGLEILSVSLDSKVVSWKTAIEADGLSWIHVSSLKGWRCPVASLYRINSVPSMFILDENNRIIATKVSGEQAREIIGKILD